LNENAVKFKEFAEKNPEVMEKLKAAKNVEEIIAIAAENGFSLETSDFATDTDEEISLDELENVAGGDACDDEKECWCLGVFGVSAW